MRERECVCVCTRVNAYMYACMWLVLTSNNSHFLEEVEVSIGVGVPIGLAQSGSRVEEVDSQVRVFPFHRLADVLSTQSDKLLISTIPNLTACTGSPQDEQTTFKTTQ